MIINVQLRHRVAASILAGAVLVAGCGSDDDAATDGSSEETSDGTTDASTTVAPTTTAAPVATVAPTTAEVATTVAPTKVADPVEAWSMEAVGPGTFATTVMEPAFTLTYGEGWVPLMPESRNQLNIEIPESSELGCAPCALLGVSAAEAASPDAVVEFATGNGLELSDPEAVEVGGIPARRYEVLGGSGYIFESEFSAFGVDSADGPARFTVLEAGGRVIVIHELAMPDVVDTMWPTSEEVIATIEWSVG